MNGSKLNLMKTWSVDKKRRYHLRRLVSSSDTQNLKEYFEGPPVISIIDHPLQLVRYNHLNGSAEDGDGVALVYVLMKTKLCYYPREKIMFQFPSI
jgi:hypothetical protein